MANEGNQILKDSRDLCITAKQLRAAAKAIQSRSKEVRSLREAFDYSSYTISSSKKIVLLRKAPSASQNR